MQPETTAATRGTFDPFAPGFVAVSASVLAHGALAFASGLLDFGADERPEPRPLTVVLLDASVLLPPLDELPATTTPAPPRDDPEPTSAAEETGAAKTEASPLTRDAPDDGAAVPPETDRLPSIEQSLLEDAEHTRAQRERLQRADLELATALAVARARESILHRPRPRTFSLADLTPEGPPAEPGPAKSVFDSPSVGRAGLEERTALGQTVRWVSDECFQTAGASNLFGFPAGADIYNLPTTNCVRTKPRRDLFEHLKRDRETTTLPAAPQ